jgi:hypothetical protein
MSDPRFTYGNRFLNCMITDRVAFLFKGRFRFGRVGNLGLIVTIDKGRAGQRYSHHAKFIMQSPQLFNSVLHCDAFCTKDRGLNCGLFLGNPVNQCHIAKIKKPVRERQVLFSSAWSLSHIMQASRSLPRGGGMSEGIASSTLP